MEDIHNYKRQLERELILLKKDSISPENKEQLIKFKDYLSSEGLGAARIKKYIGQARKYCKMLNSPVESADESDIRRIMGQIEQSELSPETKRDFKIFLRKFYQFLRGCGPDDEMPPEVKWLKLKIQKSKKKQPEELIREVETKGMIMSGISTRDRAFVCLLSETGARISEIGTIKLKNISFEKYGVRIRVIGKTGPRSILVVFSTPYLKHWINKHPDNNNPEAYLWPNPKGELLSYAALTKILKKAAEKAGISKRIHPHLMRHSRATQLSKSMAIALISEYLGWVQGSAMPQRYFHLTGKSADSDILKINGIRVDENDQDQSLKPLICNECGTINEFANKFCNKCSSLLSEKEVHVQMTQDVKRTKAEEVLNQLLKDPETLQFLSDKLNSMKKNIPTEAQVPL